MNAAYSDTIRRWAVDDRRVGTLPDPDGTGEVGLAAGEAGTRLAVRFTLRLRGDRIAAVRYQVYGCGFTIAACAAAAELAEGRTRAETAAVTAQSVAAVLGGLPEERGYCADLAAKALQAAIRSAGNGHVPVAAVMAPGTDHAPLVSTSDPVYRLLIDSPAPPDAPPEDRHLFACLLAVASGESSEPARALGLRTDELETLLRHYFPPVAVDNIGNLVSPGAAPAPTASPEILALLLSFLPNQDSGNLPSPSRWLAQILATRAARPGHLWLAMGLFSRPELTASIHRHLPTLAAANSKGMRWKRFFYKRLCEQSGGTMCRTPNCGECSEYPVCFVE